MRDAFALYFSIVKVSELSFTMSTVDYNGGDPFNAAMYIYLQPELQAIQGIITPEDATAYHDTNGTLHDLWSVSMLPSRFDATVYIADNRESIDVSGLNDTIRSAMLAEGWDLPDIVGNGAYISTIFRRAWLISANTFRFNVATGNNLFYISSSNLRIGDEVKILRNGVDSLYCRVDTIIDNQTIVLVNDRFSITDP